LGANGQFINVVPSQDLVWVRMGEAPTNDLVPFLLNDQIWEYINALECQGGLNETARQDISIFPNPTTESITISHQNDNSNQLSCSLLDASGREMKSFLLTGTETQIDISDLKSGIYFVKVGNWMEKLVVE
jgi:hypothetical protein